MTPGPEVISFAKDFIFYFSSTRWDATMTKIWNHSALQFWRYDFFHFRHKNFLVFDPLLCNQCVHSNGSQSKCAGSWCAPSTQVWLKSIQNCGFGRRKCQNSYLAPLVTKKLSPPTILIGSSWNFLWTYTDKLRNFSRFVFLNFEKINFSKFFENFKVLPSGNPLS